MFESTKYYILLALADGPKHGYKIQKQVAGDTLGLYLRSSTLYPSLKALARDGLIELEKPGSGRGRNLCRLTGKGQNKLELESRTFRRACELAQQRLGYR